MSFRKRSLFSRSNRRRQRYRISNRTGGHEGHNAGPNWRRMIVYLVIILFNLWYRFYYQKEETVPISTEDGDYINLDTNEIESIREQEL